jgi:hypothetical protein
LSAQCAVAHSGPLRTAQSGRSCRGTGRAAVVPIDGPLLLRTLRQEFGTAELPESGCAVHIDCAGQSRTARIGRSRTTALAGSTRPGAPGGHRTAVWHRR